MSNVMLEIFRRVFFGMRSDVLAFKVSDLISDFEFLTGVNEY